MPYKRPPKGHTEFGGAEGLIDPMVRSDGAETPEENLMELYAINPCDPKTTLQKANLNAVPRPEPYEWPDKKTKAGTVES